MPRALVCSIAFIITDSKPINIGNLSALYLFQSWGRIWWLQNFQNIATHYQIVSASTLAYFIVWLDSPWLENHWQSKPGPISTLNVLELSLWEVVLLLASQSSSRKLRNENENNFWSLSPRLVPSKKPFPCSLAPTMRKSIKKHLLRLCVIMLLHYLVIIESMKGKDSLRLKRKS